MTKLVIALDVHHTLQKDEYAQLVQEASESASRVLLSARSASGGYVRSVAPIEGAKLSDAK